MSVAEALRRGRAAVAQLMTDIVTITRAGSTTFDPNTGRNTPGAATTLYAGPADVKPMAMAAAQQEAADREVTLRSYDVKLPFTVSADIRLDDTVTVSASPDPTLAGLVLVVTDVQHGARRTARHLIAEDRS